MKVCFICGHILKELGQINGKKISKCSCCGLGQTSCAKNQKEDYHRDETYIEEELLFKNIFQKRVNIILSFKKNGKVLEIGCSTGLMLQLLKNRGWETLGIEISKKAAMTARKRGIKVIEEKFENAKLDGKFDLISFNHTLEHLENPAQALQKANSLLDKNGLLYIDVPNFGGLSAKVYRSKWPLLLLEEHLWHFSYKSLEILLKKMGFKIIFIDQSSGIWNVDNPLLEIFNSLAHFKKRFFTEVLTAVPSLIVSKLGMGSDLMVIVKKI